jgi:hypothetical protein
MRKLTFLRTFSADGSGRPEVAIAERERQRRDASQTSHRSNATTCRCGSFTDLRARHGRKRACARAVCRRFLLDGRDRAARQPGPAASFGTLSTRNDVDPAPAMPSLRRRIANCLRRRNGKAATRRLSILEGSATKEDRTATVLSAGNSCHGFLDFG